MTALSTFGLGISAFDYKFNAGSWIKRLYTCFFSLVFSNDFCFHWSEKDLPAKLKIRNLTTLMVGVFNIVSCCFVKLYF